MKFGKKTKFGGPSAAFCSKKSALVGGRQIHYSPVRDSFAKAFNEPLDTLEETNDSQAIKIYLDDERPCPEGWTLARNIHEFNELLRKDEEFLSRITHVSLDWHLGFNQPDGNTVVNGLASMFYDAYYDDKVFLPNLKIIGFHSSDSDQARRMRTKIAEVFEGTMPDRLDTIRLRLGSIT
jgi:hypothetical protein